MPNTAPQRIPLEDNYLDIIRKAQSGLKLPPIPEPKNEKEIRSIAHQLHLGADALVASSEQAWYPQIQDRLEGLLCFNTSFEDMSVNSYLIFDPLTQVAAAFDTGSDCTGMLISGLKIEQIFITHIHYDHIFDLDRLKEKTGATAYVSQREPIDGAVTFEEGKIFMIGSIKVETRRTSGHARGGITYFITGLQKPLAIVGDALFAGSMGGGKVNFDEALKTTRENILTLPDETIVCSGHGPLTTVGEEKIHNPFFSK